MAESRYRCRNRRQPCRQWVPVLVLRSHDCVLGSVADPGCLSRFRIFSIPDPGSRVKKIPDPETVSNNLSNLRSGFTTLVFGTYSLNRFQVQNTRYRSKLRMFRKQLASCGERGNKQMALEKTAISADGAKLNRMREE
jgi:hypothetical protein